MSKGLLAGLILHVYLNFPTQHQGDTLQPTLLIVGKLLHKIEVYMSE